MFISDEALFIKTVGPDTCTGQVLTEDQIGGQKVAW